MKHKLISVALVTILLFMILGSSIGCGGGGGGGVLYPHCQQYCWRRSRC